jgi:Flp pilus assembly protein TadD
MNRIPSTAALIVCLSLTSAYAVDTTPPPPAVVTPAVTAAAPSEPASPLAEARKLIAQNRWRDAIAELQRVNQQQSADWQNLMGYSHRKAKTPDLEAAQRHYDEALRLDPKHRGALEYSGELFLMKNDVASAKQRLEQLEALCGKRCFEYAELEVAIGKHEAQATATR